MNGSHFDKETQRERTCSLVHGTWRCVGVKIACAGACALMVGQLLLPSVALATECVDLDAAAGEVAAAPATPTGAADAAAATVPATDAAPATQAVAEPQQTAPTGATDESNDAAPAEQNIPSDTAATPASDAIMPCGVTDVTGGGGVTFDTNVESYYRACELPSEISLTKGGSFSWDFGPVPDEVADKLSTASETKYYKADATTSSLVEVTDQSQSNVTISIAPYEGQMRATLTLTGGDFVDGSYALIRNEDVPFASTLTYDGTDYNDDGILIGDPDGISDKPAQIVIHETRTDYYLQYNFNTVVKLAAHGQAINSVDLGSGYIGYRAGDTPTPTIHVPYADYDKYEIAYECWEEMDNSDPTDLRPVAFWYSDEGMYTPGMKRIDKFEEGKHYMHSVMLRQKNGYEFANDCTVAINGEPLNAMSVQKVEGGLFLAPTTSFTCEKALVWQAIDTVEINGATVTFKDGDKPVFTGATSEDTRYWYQCEFWMGSDGSSINSSSFFDQGNTNRIDTFKPGVTYRYGFYLKSHEGFHFTRDTRVVINGKQYGYTWSASDLDNIEQTGGTSTMWVDTDLTFTPEATPTPDPQPTPDPNPTPQPEVKPEVKPETKPEVKPEAKPEAKPSAKPATTTTVSKTVEKATPAKKSDAVLVATGDTTAMTVAALGIVGATAAAAGVAATKRRKR